MGVRKCSFVVHVTDGAQECPLLAHKHAHGRRARVFIVGA